MGTVQDRFREDLLRAARQKHFQQIKWMVLAVGMFAAYGQLLCHEARSSGEVSIHTQESHDVTATAVHLYRCVRSCISMHMLTLFRSSWYDGRLLSGTDGSLTECHARSFHQKATLLQS